MNESIPPSEQSSSSLSTEALEEIIQNCQRNEQRLHELQRHTRHERKKAERLLRETYRKKQEREKQISISLNETLKPRQQPIEYFVSFDDDNHRQDRPSFDHKTHRVRFQLPEKDHDIQPRTEDDQLVDLTRRCEDLLSRIDIDATIFNNSTDSAQQISSNDQSITLQQSLERFRPEFISHSRQRVERINHLREEREHQQILPSFHTNPIIPHSIHSEPPRFLLTYEEMKQASKKKYDQLPEVCDRLQQGITNEMKRRNHIRAKIFRIRLRQHVLLHGRTNIDESVTMIDT